MSEEETLPPKIIPETFSDHIEANLYSLQVAHIKNELKKEMEDEYPGLANFVFKMMKSTLNPAEEVLVGTTSLAVFQYSKRIGLKPDPIPEEEKADWERDGLGNLSTLPNLAATLEMGDVIFGRDNNTIFEELQEETGQHPEIGTYIANQMKKSISLEEANIVGTSALVVFQIIKFPFSRNT